VAIISTEIFPSRTKTAENKVNFPSALTSDQRVTASLVMELSGLLGELLHRISPKCVQKLAKQ
jgi:hypothetical protein